MPQKANCYSTNICKGGVLFEEVKPMILQHLVVGDSQGGEPMASHLLSSRWSHFLLLWALAVLLPAGSSHVAADEPKGTEGKPSGLRTVKVQRGDLAITVNAQGTLQPMEVVDVGAQVAGAIVQLGLDPRGPTDPRYRGRPIDWGTPVEKGDLLARIDDALYVNRVKQEQALCRRAEGELALARAKAGLAAAQWRQAQEGIKAKTISVGESEMAKFKDEAARASVLIAEAALAHRKAVLEGAEVELRYTLIKSPIKGIIIDRRVNVGQNITASLSAPSLFLIAGDLKKMEIWTSVDEADILKVHQGQRVRYQVDAYPGEVYQGQVEQIRLNAAMTRDGVTYTVVVRIDNAHGKLYPYLTAKVQIEGDAGRRYCLFPMPPCAGGPRPNGSSPKCGRNGRRAVRLTLWFGFRMGSSCVPSRWNSA